MAPPPCSLVWVDLAPVVYDQRIETGFEIHLVPVFENGETSQASLDSLGGGGSRGYFTGASSGFC